jgi:isocitrate dehydrogenase
MASYRYATFDASVQKAYGTERRVSWMKVFAAKDADPSHGERLPDETLETFMEFVVSSDGPVSRARCQASVVSSSSLGDEINKGMAA